MPNKTIYVKDEALWERAKALAGKDGFSGLIGKALADFVERNHDQERGLADQSILVRFSRGEQLIRFKGRSLGRYLTGRGHGELDAEAEVYETKGGKFVLVLSDAASGDAYDYNVYDSLDELAADNNALAGIPDRDWFLDQVKEAMGEQLVVWID